MIEQLTPVPTAIDTLNPDPLNPRVMPAAEMLKLRRSLREFGFLQPLVAREEDGLLIGGHQRLEAYKAELRNSGSTEAEVQRAVVPVVFVKGLTDEKARILNLALNKIGGEWDYEKLAEVVGTFEGLDPEILDLSGFTSFEFQDISSLMSSAAAEVEPFSQADNDKEIADGLAEQARRFSFKVDTDAQAATVRAALIAFGMTGPGDAANALIALAAAVTAAKLVPLPIPEIKAKAPRKSKPKEDTNAADQ